MAETALCAISHGVLLDVGETGFNLSGDASATILLSAMSVQSPASGGTWCPQCLKCRRPVKTMQIDASSQAWIESLSRTDPPG